MEKQNISFIRPLIDREMGGTGYFMITNRNNVLGIKSKAVNEDSIDWDNSSISFTFLNEELIFLVKKIGSIFMNDNRNEEKCKPLIYNDNSTRLIYTLELDYINKLFSIEPEYLEYLDFKVGVFFVNSYRFNETAELGVYITSDYYNNIPLVLKKWTVAQNKKSVLELNLRNTNDGCEEMKLLEKLASKITPALKKELINFKRDIIISSQIPLDRDILLPIVLNILNRNRNETGLEINNERLDKIKYDYKIIEKHFEEFNSNEINYSDLFKAIMVRRHTFLGKMYETDFSVKLGALATSNAYRDFKATVKKITKTSNFKAKFEAEQLSEFNKIRSLL